MYYCLRHSSSFDYVPFEQLWRFCENGGKFQMNSPRCAIDPLWQCLCPSWSLNTSLRTFSSFAPRTRPHSPVFRIGHPASATRRAHYEVPVRKHVKDDATLFRNSDLSERYKHETTPYLYSRLHALALGSKVGECRQLVEHLLRDKHEAPNVRMYNALIASNAHHSDGAAWRVHALLEEMNDEGITPDLGTCQALLRAIAVHTDHLLRSDVLEYMRSRWYQLDEESAHFVAAGLLREGLYEQAVERLDAMRKDGMRTQPWLLDMFVYALCSANEPDEAYRILRSRQDGGELLTNRNVWYTLLDAASSMRHQAGTAFAWNHQVGTGYINPSAGICLNVLTTAARAGDPLLATDVFSHLAKQGTTFKPIHYQLLIDCYLSSDTPDLKRAISILTIMPLERLDPSATETRSLFVYLRDKPNLVPEALSYLRQLSDQARRVPIAALNLLIEVYVEQDDLDAAWKMYKLMHTFVPINQRGKRNFANIDTFNLLLRGCRKTEPPNEHLASFIVSELLALRVRPTALTYDRLILVYAKAGLHALGKTQSAQSSPTESTSGEAVANIETSRVKGLELLDWAYRHFVDMQSLADPMATEQHHWAPRFGTVDFLARALASVRDARCWNVLQAGEDRRESVAGWEAKGSWARRNVEEAWARAEAGSGDSVESADSEGDLKELNEAVAG